MKKILASLLLLPFLGNAQDCKLRTETDAFTHEVKITTGFVKFNTEKADVSISIDATASEVDIFFWVQNESKCFDNESSAQVNYDGDRLKGNFKNGGSMNCEGAFHVIFRNTRTTPSNLARFTDKKIGNIKLTNGKVVTEIIFTEEQKQKLMAMAACLVKEAKTLIK